MSTQVYQDGELIEEWRDGVGVPRDSRQYINHKDPTKSRPYNQTEHDEADVREAKEFRSSNEKVLRDGLANVLVRAEARKATLLAIKALPNADINASPAKHIKDVADASRQATGDIVRLTRLVGNLLDSANTE